MTSTKITNPFIIHILIQKVFFIFKKLLLILFFTQRMSMILVYAF